ncbi:MAG: hypothetical protein IPM29_13695 [Planctomycetes bacterium]|nr:hypothetical protein [Planctomycetota bacterium]
MPLPTSPSSRLARTASAAAALLSACSGGGAAPTPGEVAILEFRALRSDYLLGESARLRVRYQGGSGRVEPGVGAVGPVSVVDTPPLRVANSFELIVDSGTTEERRRVDIGARYRERLRSVPMGFHVTQHATLPTVDGGALVIAGDQGLSILGYEVFRFDVGTLSFRPFAQLAFGREQHCALRLDDDTVLVVGGLLSLNRADTPSEVIDERTRTVTRSGSLVRNRTGHTATRLADGRVLVLGGSSTDRIEPDVRASAELWDRVSGTFRLLTASMSRPRVGHTATLLSDGRVLVFGGDGRAGHLPVAELFDPATESFVALPDPEPDLRTLHVAVSVGDGAVWLLGGADAQRDPRSDALRFDPATRAFATLPPLRVARSEVVAATLADGRVLVTGGLIDAVGTPTKAVEIVDQNGNARTIDAMQFERRGHTITRLAGGEMLIVGGERSGGVLVETAEILD